jgi:hypothetical protein
VAAASVTECPENLVCFTIEEAGRIDERLIELEAENKILKRKLRWTRPWASVGVEYLPDLDDYDPYAIGGWNLGRVSVWGGFFGDEPAVGIGMRF